MRFMNWNMSDSNLLPDSCPLCIRRLESDDDVVEIRQKGDDGISAASISDAATSLISPTSTYNNICQCYDRSRSIHVSCPYAQKTITKIYQSEMTSPSLKFLDQNYALFPSDSCYFKKWLKSFIPRSSISAEKLNRHCIAWNLWVRRATWEGVTMPQSFTIDGTIVPIDVIIEWYHLLSVTNCCCLCHPIVRRFLPGHLRK